MRTSGKREGERTVRDAAEMGQGMILSGDPKRANVVGESIAPVPTLGFARLIWYCVIYVLQGLCLFFFDILGIFLVITVCHSISSPLITRHSINIQAKSITRPVLNYALY